MIGTKLANYEITGHLGSGGKGEVYQATDTKLGRSVATKILPEASRVMRIAPGSSAKRACFTAWKNPVSARF